jgi:hypothetical protein
VKQLLQQKNLIIFETMNQRLQEKLARYKASAKSQEKVSVDHGTPAVPADGLSKVIRSKKDDDDFMAALKAVKRSGK